ncbi:chemotaxis protein CheD [Acanthopleuribacter pedis]|uniref:Probable chemoreceptor glutamine deamidase CheD n=1 Tax=Acanthopleuribacter pedis TaxID=442870 RepID=A0A8J7U5W8_9BACT|nr:chemotaxis protein CheD [Acanthopleuribacter pedis]
MKQYQCTRREPDSSFVKPGFGLVPHVSERLWTVVGASVVVTLHDHARTLGGMNHYFRPIRVAGQPATSIYAAPALAWLIRQFLQAGSRREDLEAQIFGGAENRNAADYEPGLGNENVRAGREILQQQGIEIGTMDVGGFRGRKIVFNCRTGESIVARVDRIRSSDWYPRLGRPST